MVAWILAAMTVVIAPKKWGHATTQPPNEAAKHPLSATALVQQELTTGLASNAGFLEANNLTPA